MNKDNNDLPNKCIKLIEYDSNNVFKIYNKVINKEYGRWIEIYNKLKEFSQEIKKPINIIVKNPFLGFHSQGMRIIEHDKIIIKIWGIDPCHLIHELAHCYFPSKNKSFHEGFADYVQNLYYDIDKSEEKEKQNDNKKIRKAKLISIFNQICIIKKINSPSILYEIWSNFEYYNDTRCFNMFVSRTISMLFVDFLIEKYGIEGYFNRFHYYEVNSHLENDLVNLFYEFYNLNLQKELVINKKINNMYIKYKIYNKKWDYFNKFNLPSIGNPMAYLKKYNIDRKESNMAIKIYKKELKLFNKILSLSRFIR